MAIGGKGQLNHITQGAAVPSKGTPEHIIWEQADLNVCSWVLENMEPELMANYVTIQTAKDLWEALYSTYSQQTGGVQIYDLTVRANTIRQGTETLEAYYNNIQRLWRELDMLQPNPMNCQEDIVIFNKLKSDMKLFQFLSGISEEFDADKRDILKNEPLPSPESAYNAIRKERDRRQVMIGAQDISSSSPGVGSGLVAQSKNPTGASKFQ